MLYRIQRETNDNIGKEQHEQSIFFKGTQDISIQQVMDGPLGPTARTQVSGDCPEGALGEIRMFGWMIHPVQHRQKDQKQGDDAPLKDLLRVCLQDLKIMQ